MKILTKVFFVLIILILFLLLIKLVINHYSLSYKYIRHNYGITAILFVNKSKKICFSFSANILVHQKTYEYYCRNVNEQIDFLIKNSVALVFMFLIFFILNKVNPNKLLVFLTDEQKVHIEDKIKDYKLKRKKVNNRKKIKQIKQITALIIGAYLGRFYEIVANIPLIKQIRSYFQTRL